MFSIKCYITCGKLYQILFECWISCLSFFLSFSIIQLLTFIVIFQTFQSFSYFSYFFFFFLPHLAELTELTPGSVLRNYWQARETYGMPGTELGLAVTRQTPYFGRINSPLPFFELFPNLDLQAYYFHVLLFLSHFITCTLTFKLEPLHFFTLRNYIPSYFKDFNFIINLIIFYPYSFILLLKC